MRCGKSDVPRHIVRTIGEGLLYALVKQTEDLTKFGRSRPPIVLLRVPEVMARRAHLVIDGQIDPPSWGEVYPGNDEEVAGVGPHRDINQAGAGTGTGSRRWLAPPVPP